MNEGQNKEGQCLFGSQFVIGLAVAVFFGLGEVLALLERVRGAMVA